jgi:hypothetical protein
MPASAPPPTSRASAHRARAVPSATRRRRAVFVVVVVVGRKRKRGSAGTIAVRTTQGAGVGGPVRWVGKVSMDDNEERAKEGARNKEEGQEAQKKEKPPIQAARPLATALNRRRPAQLGAAPRSPLTTAPGHTPTRTAPRRRQRRGRGRPPGRTSNGGAKTPLKSEQKTTERGAPTLAQVQGRVEANSA